MKISGVIISFNEEQRIEDAIRSLQKVCAEVVVVDSHSTDRTREIAQSMGAKVQTQPFLGDGPQKRFAASRASYDWILSIDADERLSNELIEEIKNLDFNTGAYDAYSMPRKNLIGDRWISCCGWYPDRLVRLYHRSHAQYSDSVDHGEVLAKNIVLLQHPIVHLSFAHLGELFVKADRFTTRGAKDMFKKGKRCSVFAPWAHGLAAFVKKFFVQGGILGGLDGWTISLSAFVHHYLKYAKLLELHRDPRVRKSMKLDEIY